MKRFILLVLARVLLHGAVTTPSKKHVLTDSESDAEVLQGTLKKTRAELSDSQDEHQAELTDSELSDVVDSICGECSSSRSTTACSSGSSASGRGKASSGFKDRFLNWDLLRAVLRGSCECALRRGGRDGKSCYDPFLDDAAFQQLQGERSQWVRLHKLDQDRLVDNPEFI